METLKEKQSEKQECGMMIDSIAETLKKHCATRYDVESFLNSLTGSSKFVEELQMHRHDITFKFREIAGVLKSHGTKENIELFEEISDIFLSGLILSGQLSPGNQLIYRMNNDLQSII